MYHYTYLIWHRPSRMKYIGVRSSILIPSKDTNYWGSSKHLPVDVATTHKKRVLKIFSTRKEALDHEIALHNKYDVAVNPNFYNKAKQTSTKFDTSGTQIPEEHKNKIRLSLKNREFSLETRQKISQAVKSRVVSEEAKQNMSKAQKALAATPGYVSPSKGVPLSENTKKKLSESIKAARARKPNYKASPKFKPWFILDTSTGVKQEFLTETKEDFAKRTGISISSLRSAASRSKGTFVIKRGEYANKIVGNLEDVGKTKPISKHAWFITHENFSEFFHYTTAKAYAEEHGIAENTVRDAIHISRGVKAMKKGQFKGKILGKIY